MNKLFSHSSYLREHLLAIIGVCLCVYFTYHAVVGNRGLVRMVTLNSQMETMSQKESSVKADISKLEKKVVMMRPGSIDKDLLEEQVRQSLGYSAPQEFTVLSN